MGWLWSIFDISSLNCPEGFSLGFPKQSSFQQPTSLSFLASPESSPHLHQCSQKHLQNKLLKSLSQGLLLGESCLPSVSGVFIFLKQIGSLTAKRETRDEGILINQIAMWGNKLPQELSQQHLWGGHIICLHDRQAGMAERAQHQMSETWILVPLLPRLCSALPSSLISDLQISHLETYRNWIIWSPAPFRAPNPHESMEEDEAHGTPLKVCFPSN